MLCQVLHLVLNFHRLYINLLHSSCLPNGFLLCCVGFQLGLQIEYNKVIKILIGLSKTLKLYHYTSSF